MSNIKHLKSGNANIKPRSISRGYIKKTVGGYEVIRPGYSQVYNRLPVAVRSLR